MYKQLTWGNNAMGGTASLRLENPDEPFLSGIRLDATPAAKRARETHSLSGGEKSIAALALLFAIQGFRPSPVFIMDEVDAALDPDNVKIVADYLRKKAHAGPRPALQSIVISHKQLLYSRADALVGVCLDGDHAYASKTARGGERGVVGAAALLSCGRAPGGAGRRRGADLRCLPPPRR